MGVKGILDGFFGNKGDRKFELEYDFVVFNVGRGKLLI